MEQKISIRVATANDIGSIREIAFNTWPVAYSTILSEEQLQYMLGLFYSEASLTEQINNGHTFLLVTSNESPVGFASFNLTEPKKYKLQKLYVLPATHKTGSGKLLLNEVIERVKKLGADTLQLNVNRHNKAIGFYQKMGFKIIKEVNINIGNDYFMNDYVMEKSL